MYIELTQNKEIEKFDKFFKKKGCFIMNYDYCQGTR